MAKGLVNKKMEERHTNFMQYEKGYQQALLDVETWIDEAAGDMDYVLFRLDGAKKREHNN